MVTEERVWAALGGVPDPEIPAISVVDLGVVRRVAVEGDRVRVRFAPTFLGCPAVEVMRDRMADAIRALGAEPEIEVAPEEPWSTDRITPEGRRKLREVGFAPPVPSDVAAGRVVGGDHGRPERAGQGQPVRAGQAPPLQIGKAIFRCPYCGSAETRLENLFGPTPCRSIRYCASCRQPFEQFKTL